MNSLGYFWREVLANLATHPLVTLSAVTTVLTLQLCLGTFALAWLNLDHWTRVFTHQLQVVAFLREDIDGPARLDLVKKLQMTPHVLSIKFVDKDEAFQQLQKDLHGKVTLEDVGENPLPDRLDIQVDDAAFVPDVATSISTHRQIFKVKYGGDITKRLLKLSKGVNMAGMLTSALLAIATITVISNTIRISVFSRKSEIEIMQMLGATRAFIQLPFVFEGIIQGFLGTILAACLLWPGYTAATEWLLDNLAFLPGLAPETVFPSLVTAQLAIGLVVGATGSALSVSRYIKV